MDAPSAKTEEMIRRIREGDAAALGELFARDRERLERMIRLRLDPRLRSRLDPADVIQEVCLEATRRLREYLQNPSLPFFIWLRVLAAQKLVDLHRRHLGAKARDPRREISLERCRPPEASSADLAAQLIAGGSSPSNQVLRAERRMRIQEALESMESKDRDVLIARHFEHLTNAEAARELGIKESTASHRYLRALSRLRMILGAMTDGPPDTWLRL